jgi:hypothetical protein
MDDSSIPWRRSAARTSATVTSWRLGRTDAQLAQPGRAGQLVACEAVAEDILLGAVRHLHPLPDVAEASRCVPSWPNSPLKESMNQLDALRLRKGGNPSRKEPR